MHITRTKQGDKGYLKLRKKLRSNMTFSENKLWQALRRKQLKGLKFRRQHGIGPYIVDFYCPELRFVIEIDGDTHTEKNQIIRDAEREEYLRKLGLKILRYINTDIIENIDGVVESLLDYIEGAAPLYPPLQRGEI